MERQSDVILHPALLMELARETKCLEAESIKKQIIITILYDNNPFDSRLEQRWGFSCLIKGTDETILFDTGGNGKALLSNMKILGIEP